MSFFILREMAYSFADIYNSTDDPAKKIAVDSTLGFIANSLIDPSERDYVIRIYQARTDL
ncbi:hypothetical protein KY328_00530 [Candidatus Woesearchaeota archaeon]|nr:hypothetical protein [Candidatus Woesearchaeota archaeon]MBW3021382.1 hypothetical protein [Candidatus Woesearchaeota archaeon]